MVPLGLGLPVHRVPIITFTIVVVCTLKYFSIDTNQMKNYEKEAEANQESIKKTNTYQNLKYEFCLLKAEKNFECKSFAFDSDKKILKDKSSNSRSRINLENIFIFELLNKSKEITNLKHFPAYDLQTKNFEHKLTPFIESNNFLTKENQGIKEYFMSMFTHANFLHLLGNMLALIAFGIYVENKIGHLAMTLSYLTAGLVSSFIFINFFIKSMTPLCGASGAIAGIMGMFYLGFHRHYLKFWLFFKTFLLPVNIYFPLIYVMNDVLLHLQGDSNIAAMAHIAGMLTGLGIMIALMRVLKTPYPFIYVDELEFYAKIRNKILNNKDVERTTYWLERNPINYLLREKLIISLWSNVEAKKVLSNSDRTILRNNIRKLIGRSLFFNKGKSILKTIELIPLRYSLSQFLEDFQNKDIVKIYNLCLKKGATISSLRMACVLLERLKVNHINNTIIENIKSSSINHDPDTLKLIFDQCQNIKARAEIIGFVEKSIIKESA